jgi:LysM repeat protein
VLPSTAAGLPARERPPVPPILTIGIAALLLVGCLVVGGISAWVLVLRDLGEPTSLPTDHQVVGLVATFTPRPATATYTPTPSPTASRTPTPTITPPATDTPVATFTSPLASPTPNLEVTAAALTAEARASETAYQTYTVKPGETLSEIAARFGLSVQALADANGITNPALIRPGQVLIIPAPETMPTTSPGTPTPTWTPLVLSTATATVARTRTPEATSTRPPPTNTPTPTPTKSGPSPTPKPTATPTPKPAVLSGKIAFTVWNPHISKYELYVSRIDGSGRNLLGQGFRQPQFRQDGNMLAVNGEGAPNFEHLVKMNASGGEKVEISNYTEDSYPAWSPDGNSLTFSSLSWGDDQSRLGIVVDMSIKMQKWIHLGNTEIRGDYPFWMAGWRVVYHGCDFLGDHGACGLFWVSSDGGNYHRLTTHRSDTAPAGFGSRVAFMSSRDGNWEVYAVNMDGSGLKRLTNNNAADGLPTWSPDGKSIAFVSNRSGAWAIWVMDASGANQRKLFDLDGGYAGGDKDWTTERISWAP